MISKYNSELLSIIRKISNNDLDNFSEYITNYLEINKDKISKISLNEAILINHLDIKKDELSDILLKYGADENILKINTYFTGQKKFKKENKNFFRANNFFYKRDRVMLKLILEELGHPEKSIPPLIHITGSNGKGSVACFIENILKENGYTVHKFTSPSMINDSENYIVAGKRVNNDLFYNALNEVKRAYNNIKDTDRFKSMIEEADKEDIKNNKNGLNEENIKTNKDIEKVLFWIFGIASGILIFSKIKADYTIIEVINGGLNDLTNIFTENETIATVITPIITGDNHIKSFGRTIPERADQKTRLCKYGKPIITSKQRDDAIIVMKGIAREFNCPIYIEDSDYTIQNKDDYFIFEGFNKKIDIPYPKSWASSFQIQNASLALATLFTLNIKLDDTKIQKSIQNFNKFGESTIIKDGNFINSELKNKYKVILARCKNHKGLELNLEYLNSIKKDKIVYTIFSMADHQTQEGTVKILENLKKYKDTTQHLLVVNYHNKKTMEKEKMEKLFTEYNIEYKYFDEVSLAIDYFFEEIKKSNKKHILFFAPLVYKFYGYLYMLNCSKELLKRQKQGKIKKIK